MISFVSETYLQHCTKNMIYENAKELRRLGYEVEPLIQDHFVVEISAENPYAGWNRLGKAELKELAFATYANQSDPIYRTFCQSMELEGTFFMDSVDVLRQLVETNNAFVLVPALTAQKSTAVQSGKTVLKELADVSIPLHYYCIHLPEEVLSGEERAFLQFLRRFFGK